MQIYEVNFPFEVDSDHGSNNLYYPTLTKALSEASEFLRQYYQAVEGLPATLTAKVSLVETVPLSRESLVAIINTHGCSFAVNTRLVYKITLTDGKKLSVKRTSGEG